MAQRSSLEVVEPAEAGARASVAAAAKADLDGGDALTPSTPTDEALAPVQVLPSWYEPAVSSVLECLCHGMAIGLANGRRAVPAQSIFQSAAQASQSAAEKLAPLLGGRYAVPLMVGGIVASFALGPLKAFVADAIERARKPAPEKPATPTAVAGVSI